MAATLSPPPPGQPSQRPYSQPHPEPPSQKRRAADKRSPNRVKAKPADPAVISSILDSFDTFSSSAHPAADDIPSENTSPVSRTYSRTYSIDGAPRDIPSPAPASTRGFGVEYGTGLSLDDEQGVTNAALPPTVRTSREPSGLSSYRAPRAPSLSSTNGGGLRRPSSISSRRSSFSIKSKEQETVSKNKLSSESWVKQNPMSRDSLDSSRPVLRKRRSLRRMSSQEISAPTGTRIELVPPAADSPKISRAEQIIAKVSTPPPSNSKRRLYLNDSGSNDEQSYFDSPAPIVENPELEDKALTPDFEYAEVLQQLENSPRPTGEAKTLSEDQKTPPIRAGGLETPRRVSPQKSPIVDSIPMRTSSLRQASSSPRPPKERKRKSKRNNEESSRKSEAKVDSFMASSSKTIPESSWADLGEDDETVKRIRELRERRKSRMLEETPSSTPEELPQPGPDSSAVRMSVEMRAKSAREDALRVLRTRPAANRASTEPPAKPITVAAAPPARPTPVMNAQPVTGNSAFNQSPERRRQANLSLDEKRLRPATSKSNGPPTPPLSLDYSYAEAVDALHGVQQEIRKERQQRAGELSPRPSLQVQRAEHLYHGDRRSSESTPVRVLSKSSRRKVPQDRWSTHPDLPLDFEKKKSRRKSTSDARATRHAEPEPEPPVPRRSSVDIAVDDYLSNPRLSRKIKHPLSGRVISYSEVGDPNGAAVFICVGMGLTRYVTAFYDELAVTLRLRLITVDRPGVGGSEPYPSSDKSGPLSWPDDVLAICQDLGISKFSMLAHSAGAIYALATALILPHYIRGKVHLLGPWIPPSQLEAIAHPAASIAPAGALPRSQRFLRVLPTPFLKAANASFMTATSASLKPNTKRKPSIKLEPGRQNLAAPPSRGQDRPVSRDDRVHDHRRRESMMLMDQFMPDVNAMENFPIPVNDEEDGEVLLRRNGSLIMSATATPMDPNFEFASTALNAAEHAEKERKTEFTSRLTQRTWELATRDSNPATDLLVCLERHRDVGFRYTDVHREVVITHGSEDKRVPVANVKWLAEQMNRRALIGIHGEDSMPPTRAGGQTEMYALGACEVRVLEGEGHGLMASPMIMGDILTEIAGYWTTPGRGRTTM